MKEIPKECFFQYSVSTRPAEHWSGARRPFGARGVVPGRAIKTEESMIPNQLAEMPE